jgi:hypothetical protein
MQRSYFSLTKREEIMWGKIYQDSSLYLILISKANEGALNIEAKKLHRKSHR